METDPDLLASFELPDGRVADIMPLIFGRARLGVGQRGAIAYDDVF